MKLSIFITCLAILSCSKVKNEKVENVEFQLPTNYSLKKEKSIDTEVFNITKNGNKIGNVFLGQYYRPFSEDKNIIPKDLYNDLRDKSNFVLARDTANDLRNGIFNSHYYYYDTINGKVAQVMLPKWKTKNKFAGIYIDSIDQYDNKFAVILKIEKNEDISKIEKIFHSIKINKK